jgi:hypothetical protein
VFRGIVRPAIVFGFSLLASAAMAGTPDNAANDPDEPVEEEGPQRPVPGLYLQLDPAAEDTDPVPQREGKTNEQVAEEVTDDDPEGPTALVKVPEEQLDKTTTLPDDVEGLPHLAYYYRMEGKDLKTGGALETPDGAHGENSVGATYRLENGSFAFATAGFTMQTPIAAADAQELPGDMINSAMSYAPSPGT